RDLSILPGGFSQGRLDEYCDRLGVSGPSARASQRSHKLVCEAYTDSSSLRVAASSSSPGDVHIKCTCYRSQKKTSKPYQVHCVLAASGSLRTSTCQCPAGASGVCSHSMATLKLVLLLKDNHYKEPPPEVSCTELPQKWRRPRSSPLAPLPLEFVDWRSVRQGGLCEPISTRFYDARKDVLPFGDVAAKIRALGSAVGATCPSAFTRQLENGDLVEVQSKVGPTPLGSPLEYLRPLVPHAFEAFVSPEIPCISEKISVTPTQAPLFQPSQTWEDSSVSCPADQAAILKVLQISPEEAAALEQNTRHQVQSQLWREARQNRVTASSFGVILSRATWTEKGLHNLTTDKDLSHVRAVK
ncbi:unnamed protein product, partial [Ixodes hexagonus]